jgi:8-oxo-dGTP pyrophosphatase MutT (NUDIX family)
MVDIYEKSHNRAEKKCPYDHGWTIEAIAGKIDPGETPEEAARREVEEETGLNISVMDAKTIIGIY